MLLYLRDFANLRANLGSEDDTVKGAVEGLCGAMYASQLLMIWSPFSTAHVIKSIPASATPGAIQGPASRSTVLEVMFAIAQPSRSASAGIPSRATEAPTERARDDETERCER